MIIICLIYQFAEKFTLKFLLMVYSNFVIF